MGKIAFVFAGQGSQYPGMGRDLYEKHPAAQDIFDLLGEKLKKIAHEGPAEELNITVNTQPCLFAVGLASARILDERGVRADAVAGFSLGEIPALAYAGLMSDAAAYDLVSFRARAMQQAATNNPGAMLAVLRLPAEEVERICSTIPRAWPVNYNCPGQTVVAAAEDSVTFLQSAVLNMGGRIIRLPVSGAFHSPFMESASRGLCEYLCNISPLVPHIPLYSNVTARPYGSCPWETLSRQVMSPVLWQRSVENMIEDGVDTFIEVGAGKVLSGLIKKINPDVRVCNVGDIPSLENTLEVLENAKG